MDEETKQLSLTEKAHLQSLLDEASRQQIASQAAIQSFVQYLAIEHDAPSDEGWRLDDVNVGFVQISPGTDPSNGAVPPRAMVEAQKVG